jgi:hypothetical protein
MQIISSDKYHQLYHYPEKSYFRFVNLPDNVEMTNEMFMAMMSNYAKLVEQYQPVYLLLDSRLGAFPVPPSVQEWVAQNIAPRTMSIKRIANLISADLFAQISVEQLMEEQEIANYYQVNYFQDQTLGENWLLRENSVTI